MPRKRARAASLGAAAHIQIRIHGALGVALGPGRAELLEHIAETGSIREAARRMAMSYNRAWTLVHSTNESFASPLVTARRGGDRRGGAALTAEGRRLLRLYRSMEAAATRAVSARAARIQQQLKA